jgi:hypothetical protein
MIPYEVTGAEGWYVLVMHAPQKSFDRTSFKVIGPFMCREEATTRGRAHAGSDAEASIRITYAEQVPFVKSIWHRADALDPPH